VGRPSRLTPETSEKILTLVRMGNYRETACAAAGIESRTMRVWLQRGAKGEKPYAEFARKMDEAEAGAEARHVMTLATASRVDWRAAAWILSRKYHDRWGDRVQVELQDRLGDILDAVTDVLGAEEAARVLEEVTRRASGEKTPAAGDPER
jgi:hypothetical protein